MPLLGFQGFACAPDRGGGENEAIFDSEVVLLGGREVVRGTCLTLGAERLRVVPNTLPRSPRPFPGVVRDSSPDSPRWPWNSGSSAPQAVQRGEWEPLIWTGGSQNHLLNLSAK